MRQTRLRSDTRFPLSWRRCRPGQEDEYKVSFVRATFQGGLDKVTTACNCNLWIPLVSLSLSLLLACLLARRLGSPQPCALSLSLFLSFFLLSFASLSLSLCLYEVRRKGSVQAPPRSGSRTCSSWQVKTSPGDFVRGGSAVLGGLSGLQTPKIAQD